MKYFVAHDQQIAVVNLEHGDAVLESLQQVAHELRWGTAVILTGFGALARLHIHYGLVSTRPYHSAYVVYEQPMELCALTGMIAADQVHAHIVASNGRETWGGHLEPETRVAYLAEIVIQRLPGLRLLRELDEYGTPLLKEME